ncbi:hypothetical protein R5R35_004330 [Gryllus longicercus]|uniref:Uncharacterized protein n=1 Tax=Gryllus longicercus TaxID=2509291 RepID=A0AAN9VLT0_9ORTH
MRRLAAWWLPLLLLAAAGAAALGDDADGGADSLKSALEAISRRQRDLAALGGAAPPLAHYRAPPADLAFLAPPRDFAGDGQPENIGYGYQKSAAAGGGGAEAAGGGRALERLLLEYVEAGGGAPPPGEKRGGGAPSVFRERAALREPLVRMRRPVRLQPLSSFRERAALQAFDAEKRGRPLELARELQAEQEAEQALVEREREEAEEEEHEREEEEEAERRQREEEEEREDEYLDLLQGLWRKYRQANPDVRRIEDLSPEDLQELLAGIADADVDEQLVAHDGPAKRQYGGFDYFNNAGALGGWQGGGMYRKRGKQRLEQPGGAGAGAGFLYALKFASPAAQRDALEALADDDDAEAGGERDEDVARLAAAAAAAAAAPVGSGGRRLTPVEWERAAAAEAAAEAAEDAFGAGPAEEYQRLLAAAGAGAGAEAPPVLRKRTRAAPRQRMLYDGIPVRKRFPVTKRSSDFYANPPLMHRRASAPPGAPQDERRRKKDAGAGAGAATDPKVANELTQIFGSELREGDAEGEGGAGAAATTAAPAPAPSSPAGGAAPPSAVPAPAAGSPAPPTASPGHGHSHAHGARNGSRELTPDEQRASSGHDSVEQPLALSRAQAPLDIQKKSVDWSEYFGLDRRRKKAGPGGDERWLMDRYRNLALASAVRKRGPALAGGADAQGPPLEAPPLDTRHFALGDIFSRASRQRQGAAGGSRLDGVDSKLQGMEDLIVNEAVKYTGAHEGATDPREVQEVKDKILARLAAAYSLEKMRLALREFKSSLQAQKMSRYNPENQQKGNEEDKKKRVAVKKEKAEEKEHEKEEQEASAEEEEEEEEETKRAAAKKAEDEATEFLEEPRGIEPLSEGYMGQAHPNAIEDECPVLVGVERKCRAVGAAAGDRAHVFLPLCTLHQICYLCGPAVGASSAAACDALFAREAALGCGEDAACALAARRSVALLRRRAPPPPPASPNASPFGPAPERCWPGSCLVQRFLAAPLGARAR